MRNSRFSFRAGIIGYAVALTFAFNGLLTSVIDAGFAAGGSPFAILCLSSSGQPQVPGQSDHGTKCSCSLSGCCAGGDLKRSSQETGLLRARSTPPLASAGEEPGRRDYLADHRNRSRSPPA